MKLFLIASTALAVVVCLAVWGCGENPDDGQSTVLPFDCEYDHVSSCDIFPDSDYAYVYSAFWSSHTEFSAYFSSEWSAGFYPQTPGEILSKARDNAMTNQNGSRVYPLYLLSVNSWDGTEDYLGVTLNYAQPGSAICVIFYEDIVWFADHHIPPLPRSQLMMAAVVHELGHGRAGLSHLCSGPNISTLHTRPNPSLTCIMADKFPKPDCLAGMDVASPLENIGFCSKCDDNLKQVDWVNW